MDDASHRTAEMQPSEGFPVLMYLKFNRLSGNALKCLQYWIQVCIAGKYVPIFVCDLPKDVTGQAFSETISNALQPSYPELRQFFDGYLENAWINAGAAHMSVFRHAQSVGGRTFWNIDADDLMFFQPPEKVAAKLREVQAYADANAYDCFSLDMYHSFYRHWSFGVTYTSLARQDYFARLKELDPKQVVKDYPVILETQLRNLDGKPLDPAEGHGNLDWYFTSLRDRKMIKAGSFYVDETYFSHLHSQQPYWLNLFTGCCVYFWHDGKLWDTPIAEDCVRFPPF